MAKLINFFIATLAFQLVLGGFETNEPDTYREKTQHDVVRMIETETIELINLLKLHRNSDEFINSINVYAERLQSIVTKLHSKSNFGLGKLDLIVEELTTCLRKTLQLIQNPQHITGSDLANHLIKISKIFEKFLEFTDLQSTEVHQFLKSILLEYCFSLKHSITTLDSRSDLQNVHDNIKTLIESTLIEILHHLKSIKLDNEFVKRTLISLINDYLHDLQKQVQMHLDKSDIHVTALLKEMHSFQIDETANEMELRNEITKCLENLITATKHIEMHTNLNKLFVHILTVTRVLEFNIYTLCTTDHRHGETTTSFHLQIRAVSNAIVNTLETISFENKQARQILVDQTHELIQNLESITMKLQRVNLETVHHVVLTLKEIIVELKKMVKIVNEIQAEVIKIDLIAAIHKATIQVEKLIWLKRGNEDRDNTIIYTILNDYLAILQHQLIQFQNIYQSTTDKQSATHMGSQIQSITNSAILYLRDVPTNDVMIREKLEVQIHHLNKKVQNILKRVSNIDNTKFQRIIQKIWEITESFEEYMRKTDISSIREVIFHFNILSQKVANEMKNLAWLANNEQLEEVVKSVLSEYLIIIENIQVKIQRINQVAQVGESPRELALQIEVVSEHLRKMLTVFASNTPLTKRTILWQLRHFDQVLGVIIDQLLAKKVTESGKVYSKVALNLKQVRVELKECMEDVNSVDVHQFRMKIGNIVVKVSTEVQNLCWISQADIQEGLGVQSTFVRSILLELLLSLQNFHIQMMHNFQVVLSGQSPTQILMDIQTISKRLFTQIQHFRLSKDYEQVMTIQLADYLQTIENTLNSLHHELKHYGDHNVEIEKIADTLGKMSLKLQNVNVDDHEFWTKVEMSLNEYVQGMHSLVRMNFEKVSQTQVGTHTGILHGMLSNMLSTLKNMYIQMQYTQHDTKSIKLHEISDRITLISNNIMPALESIVGSTTPIKQALDVQIFKYTRNLKYLLNKLDELSVTGMNKEIMEIKIKLHQSLLVLQQTASSVTTLTINDLKLHFNKLIQGVGVELQKLAHFGTNTTELTRHILLHYFKTLQNVHIQIQNISRMSHQSENYQLVAMQIDTAVIELRKFLQIVPQHHNLIAKIIVIESREMAQLILNIINRYQAAAVVQKNQVFMEVATELKKIQLFLQDLTESKIHSNFDNVVLKLVSSMESTAVLIEQLMWLPVKTVHEAQYRPDMPTFVRVTLHDFLTAVQNMFIQIANVVVHVDDKGFEKAQGMMHNMIMHDHDSMLKHDRLKMDMYGRPMNREHVSDNLKFSPKMNYHSFENTKMMPVEVMTDRSWLHSTMHNKMMQITPKRDYDMRTVDHNEHGKFYSWFYPKMSVMEKQNNRYWPNKEMSPKNMHYFDNIMMVNQNRMEYPEMSRLQSDWTPKLKTEPKSVLMEIQTITQKVVETLETKPITMKSVVNQLHQLIKVLDEIAKKMQIVEIADNLHNLKLAFENIIKRSSSMNFEQIKKEISQNLKMVSMQFQNLVMVHELRTSMLVHNVLEHYRNHLQGTWLELNKHAMNAF